MGLRANDGHAGAVRAVLDHVGGAPAASSAAASTALAQAYAAHGGSGADETPTALATTSEDREVAQVAAPTALGISEDERVAALGMANIARIAYGTAQEVRQRMARGGFDAQVYEGGSAMGFIASRQSLVVCFRGSDSLSDVFSGADAALVNDPEIPGAVHRGVHTELAKLADAGMLEDILLRHEANPDQPIYLAGHSLGAGMATLAAAWLAQRGVPVRGVFLFGSPRVGDAAFVAAYDRALGPVTLRYTNAADFAQDLPFLDSRYREVARQTSRYIRRSGEIVVNPSDAQIAADRVTNFPGTIRGWWKRLTGGNDDLRAQPVRDHALESYIAALDR